MLKCYYICVMKATQRNFSVQKLERVAKVLKTIAHPVKLEILEVLESEEPLDVSTICSKIGAECEISMMSHHLTKMKDNGILLSEKRGKQVFYRLADRKLLTVFDCMEGCELI